MATDHSLRRAAAAGFALAGGLLVVLPIAVLVAAALEQGAPALERALSTAAGTIWNSAWTGVAATVLAVAAGGGLALLTERAGLPGRGPIRLAMLVALIVPGYVAAVAWLRAYGPAGLLENLLGLSAPALIGPLGIVLVLAVEAAPIAYLIVAAGLATRAEPDTERAARASGASAWTAFRTVTLPLIWPVVLGAAAICFVLSVTAFGTPAVLGIPAGFATMTTQIYRDLAFSADPAAFSRALGLAVVLAAAAAGTLIVADALLRPRRAARGGLAAGPAGVRGAAAVGATRRRTLALAGTGWVIVGLALVVPLAGLLLTALTRAPGLPPTPDHWTLDNFARALDRHAVAALGNSVALAAGAAVGAVLLGGLAVVVAGRRAERAVGGLVGLTFALPGSTLAVAVLLAYAPLLRDTLAIILLAYLAKFWLLGYRPLAAALEQLPSDVTRAARIHGASALTTLRTISLPLLRPAIAAGALIVFLFAVHEVTISALLYGPGTATLAVVVLNLQQLGDPNATAALAVLLTLFVAGLGLPLLRRWRILEGVGWRS